MDRDLRLMMTQTSTDLCRLAQRQAPAYRVDLTVVPRNGTLAYNELVRMQPDATVLDVFMPGLDAFAVKEKYELHRAGSTRFYATGTFQNEGIEKEVMESGFSFYFLKPFDVDTFFQRILSDAGRPHARPDEVRTEQNDMITDMLRQIGVPAHIKGYRFLSEAVRLVVEDPALINAVTKDLYPEIAQKNDTSASRVERAIRHSIEVAWDRGDLDTLNHYFGTTALSARGKPTNSEFIAMLADRVLLTTRRQEDEDAAEVAAEGAF